MKHKKINPLIENRYSPRAYSREPLSEEIIESLFEAARWAASARNAQPWRFIFATPDRKETWDKLVECLTPTNQEWARDAPFLMLALVQKTDPERNSERKSALYDLGLAMGNFTLQAGHLGLHLRNMGGFSPEKARELFVIPELYEPVVMVAAGYRGDESKLPKHLAVPTPENRTRKPLDQLIFTGDWAKML
ncbi:MAG TPA: nitroreductase family protein [Prolixibacteraceae bacterium]|nr:nitroreductase family protein [Prolixibacteraceae bacterium]